MQAVIKPDVLNVLGSRQRVNRANSTYAVNEPQQLVAQPAKTSFWQKVSGLAKRPVKYVRQNIMPLIQTTVMLICGVAQCRQAVAALRG